MGDSDKTEINEVEALQKYCEVKDFCSGKTGKDGNIAVYTVANRSYSKAAGDYHFHSVGILVLVEKDDVSSTLEKYKQLAHGVGGPQLEETLTFQRWGYDKKEFKVKCAHAVEKPKIVVIEVGLDLIAQYPGIFVNLGQDAMDKYGALQIQLCEGPITKYSCNFGELTAVS